jgi:glycosyltransferase involved in cell wall biosynthesis
MVTMPVGGTSRDVSWMGMQAHSGGSPIVSVIVPVRNGERWVGGCLDALQSQSIPAGASEVIVVDNGSTDGTRGLVESYPVTLIEERARRSPYAARNAGLAKARGTVVAFTDADCRPDPEWLARGTEPLLEDRADLVAGRVDFDFSSSCTIGELTDALWHLDVAAQVEKNRSAMTSNLFVTRSVVEALGPFDGSVRSGGDGHWTRRASDAGFRLLYVPEATVRKRARKLGPLLAKAYRVGKGLPAVWVERGTPRRELGRGVLHQFLPPARARVREQIWRRGYDEMASHIGALWATTWLLEAGRGVGALVGWLRLVAPQRQSRQAGQGDGRSI